MKLDLKYNLVAMVSTLLTLLTSPAAAGSNLWLNLQKPAKNIQLSGSDPTKNLQLSGSPVLPSDQSNTALGGYDPKLENETQDKSYRGAHLNSMWMNTDQVKVTRQEFFPRYAGSLGLKLESGDKIVEVHSFVDQSYPDQKDRVMTRYQQSFQAGEGEAVPVLAGNYLLIEKDGVVYYAKGDVVSGLAQTLPSTKPQHTASEANTAALQHVGENAKSNEELKPELVIVTEDGTTESGKAHLAWRIEVTNAEARTIIVDVDANSLKVIQTQPGDHDTDFEIKANIVEDVETEEVEAPALNRTLRATDLEPRSLTAPTLDDAKPLLKPQNNNPVPGNPPPAPETADGNIACSGVGVFGETWNFKCEKNTGTVTLNCKLGTSAKDCPVQITLYDNITANTQTENSTLDSSYFIDSDSDAVFSDTNDTAGVSAAGGLQKAIEIVKSRFKHVGLDGAGKTPITIYLKDYGKEPNAYFKKKTQSLEFQGKGGEKTSGPFLAFVSIDMLGHELTHGIIHSFNPNMNGKYESGSVDEGFADIFAEIIEHYYKQESGGQADWKVSPEVFPNTGAMRDFANPKNKGQPSTYLGEKFFIKYEEDCDSKNDWCWRHLNNGPIVHWFYLLSFGGTGTGEPGLTGLQKVEGLGVDIAAQIAFNTIKRLGPNDGFKETRKASVDAAKDLYGAQSDQVKKLELAWDAVGVKASKRFSSPPDLESGVEPWTTRIQIEKLSPEDQFEVELGSDAKFDEDRQIDMECTDVPMTGSPGKTVCEFKFTLEPNHEYFWHYRPIQKGNSPNGDQVPAKNAGLWNNLNLNLNKTGQLDKSGTAVIPANLGKEFKDTEWSPIFSFKTDKKMVTALEPQAGAPVNPWKVKFAWKVQTGEVESYRYTVHDEPTLGFKSENPTDQVSDIPSDFDPLHKSRIDAGDKSHQVGDVFSDIAVMPMGKTLYWGVQAFGHNNSFSAIQWPLITFQTATPQVELLSPTPEQKEVGYFGLQFAWKPIEGAKNFKLQLSTDPSFGGNLLADIFVANKPDGAGNVSYNPALLLPEGKIYWRVTALGPEPYYETVVSEVREFTYSAAIAKPQLTYPVNVVLPHKDDNPITFTWTEVSGAKVYKVFGRHIKDAEWKLWATAPGPSQMLGVGGGPNEWCWKVVPIGATGNEGLPSDPGCYKVDQAPPSIQLAAPANGATGVDYRAIKTIFEWSPALPSGQVVMQVRPWAPGTEIPPPFNYGDSVTGQVFPLVNQTANPDQFSKAVLPTDLQFSQSYAWNIYSVSSSNTVLKRSTTGVFTTMAKVEEAKSPEGGGSTSSCTPPGSVGKIGVTFAQTVSNEYGGTLASGPSSMAIWWEPVANADGYTVEVWDSVCTATGGASCSKSFDVSQTSFAPGGGYVSGHHYDISVYARGCGKKIPPNPPGGKAVLTVY